MNAPSDAAPLQRAERQAQIVAALKPLLPQDALPPAVQAPAPEVEPGCLKVDSIAVRAGKGALVRALSASGSALGDTTYLVTDEGVKYRLLSQEAVKALGYEGVEARTMPSPMLAMPAKPAEKPSPVTVTLVSRPSAGDPSSESAVSPLPTASSGSTGSP